MYKPDTMKETNLKDNKTKVAQPWWIQLVLVRRRVLQEEGEGGRGGGGVLFWQGFNVLANYSMAKPKEYAVPKVGLLWFAVFTQFFTCMGAFSSLQQI